MAKIVGIAIKRVPRGPMEIPDKTYVSIKHGLEGDCRGKGGSERKRQVTAVSEEQWAAACREIGKELPWHTRRGNLFVSGMAFGPESVGCHLHVGNHLLLEITGETKPCERMEEACPGLREVLAKDWRGGVTCRVILRGGILVGDNVGLYP